MIIDNCAKCRDQNCIKTGKICKKVEKILRAEGIKGADWIRPEVSKETRADGRGRSREVNFSSLPCEWQKEKGIIDTYE